MKLKILQIINRPSVTGGMELYALNLSRELKNLGHEVHMALRSGTDFYEAAKREGFNIIPITRGGAIQPYNIYSIARSLIKNKYDILHAHTGNDYWPPLLAKWLTASKSSEVFVTRHILSAPRGFSSRFYFQHVNTVCVSRSVLQAMYGSSPHAAKLKLVYPGIELDRFSPEKYEAVYREKFGIKDDEYVIATMHKWFEKTFVIMQRILDKFGDIKFIVAGELKNHEVKLVNNSKHKSRINICGVIKNMPEFYKSANMFLFPSFDEAFGLVVAEAMAMGLPVVVAASGGASEIFENGSCGFKIEIEDTEGFISAVRLIKENMALHKKLSNAARFLSQQYNVKNMAKTIEELYFKSLKR